MNLILFYVKCILIEVLPVIPVVLLVRAGIGFYHWKKGRGTTVLHEIGVLLFLLFLAGLASQTISFDFLFRGEFMPQGGVNLAPFRSIVSIWNEGSAGTVLLNIWGNIGMFMPIGFMVPLLWEKRRAFRWALLYGFGASLLIECLQLFSFRTTDVDDLILNTLGACLGWLAFTLVNRLFPRLIKKFRMKN